MAIKLNPGRQYPLVLEQAFTADDLDGTNAVVAAKLPRDAIILRGYIVSPRPLAPAPSVSVWPARLRPTAR